MNDSRVLVARTKQGKPCLAMGTAEELPGFLMDKFFCRQRNMLEAIESALLAPSGCHCPLVEQP